MIEPCVALGLTATLDVAAARRLEAYDGLDDAGVVRAFEQVRVQREGGARPPRHLCAIDQLAVVIDDGERPRLLHFEPQAGEAEALRALFDAWPAAAAGHTVAWRGDDVALIAARAFMHGQRMAAGLGDWTRICLAERFVAAENGDQGVEDELARLTYDQATARGAAGNTPRPAAVVSARNRYLWWLRWQYVQGEISADTWHGREAALAECTARHETA